METIGFDSPYFTDENEARTYLEAIRWPNGPVCPHCGNKEGHYALKAKDNSQTHVRPGVWKCNKCRKQFSVTVGTVFEKSHIPLHKWLLATYLINASKKGMSSHQLHRMLDVTYGLVYDAPHTLCYGPKNHKPCEATGNSRSR